MFSILALNKAIPITLPTPEAIKEASVSATEVASPILASLKETTALSFQSIFDSVQGFVGSLNWASPSWDLFIVLFTLMSTVVYGFFLGRNRLIVLMMSVYMALAVVNVAPLVTPLLGGNPTSPDFYLIRIALFILSFVIVFFLVSRTALFNTFAAPEMLSAWWHVFLLSFLQVGLLLSVVLSFLPPESGAILSPFIRELFTTPTARAVWIVLPMLAMALVR